MKPRRHRRASEQPIVRDRRAFPDAGQFPSDECPPTGGEPLAILTGSSMLGGAQVTCTELATACRQVGFDPTVVICRPFTAHPQLYRHYREFPCRRMTYEDFDRLPADQHRQTHVFAQGLYRAGAGGHLMKLLAKKVFRSVTLRHASSCGLYPLQEWLHPAVRHVFVNSLFALRFDVGSLYRNVRIHVQPPPIAFDHYHRPLEARMAAWQAGQLVAGRAQRPDVRKFDAATYRYWDQLADMGIRFRTMGADPRGLEPDGWEVVPFASCDVRDFYSSIDVMLYQTDRNCQEAAGRIIVESMAQGVVPVVHDWGGMNEYVQHGHNGYVFHTWTDAKHHLAALRDDLDLRVRLAEAAIETARQHDAVLYGRLLWAAVHEPDGDPAVYRDPPAGRYKKSFTVGRIPGVPVVVGRR